MTVDIKRLTAHLSQSQQGEITRAYKKQQENETAAFLWCFFLGWMGAHRFYLRQWGQAFVHLLLVIIVVGIIVVGVVANLNPTLVVLAALPFGLAALIWEIVDLFRIDDEVSALNLKLAETLIAASMLADTSVLQAAQTKLDEIVHNVAEQRTVSDEHEAAATEVAASEAAASSSAPVAEGVAAAEVEDGAGATVERYEATTTIRASAEPNANPADERPVAPGTRDWSESVTSSVNELASGAAAEAPGESGGEADGVQAYETVTRSHTESGFSTTDSVDTLVSESAAAADAMVVTADMSSMSTADAEAPTLPNLPLVDGSGVIATPVPLDYTDMGGSEPATPVADVDGAGVVGATPLIVSLSNEAVTPIVPTVEPVGEDTAPSSAIGEEPETLAELAGLATGSAASIGTETASPAATTAPADTSSEVAHADEEIEHTSHLLKRIRVTRQIKVNGEVIEETSAEELIDANADPEPVRQRLRQQLHNQAAARMAELGITEDQSNS